MRRLTTPRRFVSRPIGEPIIKTSRSFATPAIVLRTRAFGESDKIVTFLARDFGKLTAIAKGAARSRRRFVGALELFTHVRLGFRLRPEADLGFVESTEIVRAPRNVTRDLRRYAYSTYVLELTDGMVEGREAEPAVFDLVEEMLVAIDSTAAHALRPESLRHFETRLLRLAGLEPRLERCSRCEVAAADSGLRFSFNPRTGRLLCERCGEGTGLLVHSEAIAAMLRLRSEALSEVAALPSGVAGEVRNLLQTFLTHHLRRPLRSPALLREILGA